MILVNKKPGKLIELWLSLDSDSDEIVKELSPDIRRLARSAYNKDNNSFRKRFNKFGKIPELEFWRSNVSIPSYEKNIIRIVKNLLCGVHFCPDPKKCISKYSYPYLLMARPSLEKIYQKFPDWAEDNETIISILYGEMYKTETKLYKDLFRLVDRYVKKLRKRIRDVS